MLKEAVLGSPTTSVLLDSKEATGTSHPAYIEIVTGGGTTSVGVTAPVTNSGTASAPVIGMLSANGSRNGYLSSTDWTTFNNKGNGDITDVVAGTGLSGGSTSGSATLNLANTSVAPGSYTSADITVDAQGRITAAANGSSSGGGVSSVGVSAPVVNTGTASAPVIGISQASANTNGFLSSTDWTTFNGKGSVTNVTASAPLAVATGSSTPVISLSAASGSSDGYLSSTDWTTFNSKGSGTITGVTTGTGLTGGGTSGAVTLSLGTVPGTSVSGNIAGNAATATALAANGSNCAAGQFPLGVDAQGNAESCTVAGTGTITGVVAGTGMTGGGTSGSVSLGIATGGVGATQLADTSVTAAKIDSTGGTSGQVLKADGAGNASWQNDSTGGGGGPTVYNAAGIAQAGAKIVIGSVAIGANTTATVTFSGSAIFTSAPICVATNATASLGSISRIDAVTTSSVTIFNSNAGSGVTANYHCIGS